MAELSETTDVHLILRQWEEQCTTPGYDPIPVLTRLSEIIESETENYNKRDPDPFDERHPSRTDPDCELGRMLKILFRKDNFMSKLVSDYLRDNYFSRQNTQQDSVPLNIAACRLMLVIMPGLEISAVFMPDMDNLILRLYSWAENSSEPLQSYATGLLASAMEVQDIATTFREQNSKMVPLMLKRLHVLSKETNGDNQTIRPFAHLGQAREKEAEDKAKANETQETDPDTGSPPRKKSRLSNYEFSTDQPTPSKLPKLNRCDKIPQDGDSIMSPPQSYLPALSNQNPTEMSTSLSVPTETSAVQTNASLTSDPTFRKLLLTPSPQTVGVSSGTVVGGLMTPPSRTMQPSNAVYYSKPSPFSLSMDGCSNSESGYLTKRLKIYPLTKEVKQVMALRFLSPLGEYQEFLGHIFENNALELIMNYINVRETRDGATAFEALKYLASLLCHKKFAIEFLAVGGLLRLLEVPRPSMAATGVSICLYYLAYCEDAMERVCLMPQKVVSDLVKYALYLLSCSHDSGRCHATMFFGLSFQFKVILVEFDNQDGLRKLYNVISVLPILSLDDMNTVNEDVECAARQIVRHVCVAMKRYFEAHLYHKYLQVTRQNDPSTAPTPQPSYKACKSTPEEIGNQIRTLQELLSFRAPWACVDELLKLGGVTLLLQVIAFAYEWNYSGRAETVRSALDVLSVCCVIPRVQIQFCERVPLPEESLTVGSSIILGAAEGEIVADSDVQKSALSVLVNCVCQPIQRTGGSVSRFSSLGSSSSKKKTPLKSSEELIQKIWESVRINNGIMVLITLMMVKTPITDADSIRGLACRALAGLARSDRVRQIVSKLPLFANGQLQNLMRDPILQEKRQEHVSFQKYALELMERVSGKSRSGQFDTSLANIHKANVIAQTRIQFNDRQLFQLIHQHLIGRGMTESAAALQREGNLDVPTSQGRQTGQLLSFLYTRSPGAAPRARITSLQSTTTTPSYSPYSSGNRHATSSSFVPNRLFKEHISTEPQTTDTPTPIKIRKPNSQNMTPVPIPNQRSLEKQSDAVVPHYSGAAGSTCKSNFDSFVSLDTIITEYLYNQHALCKNPMVTCPQFDLFTPHKCPDPRPYSRLTGQSINFAARFARRALGYSTRKLDRKLTHSQFCPVRTIRPPENDAFFTCCIFSQVDSTLIVGTYNGEIKIFNANTGTEISSYTCHDSYVYNIESNRDSSLLITSSTWRRPLTAVWAMSDMHEMRYPLDDEEIAEFSKKQDKILGTKGEVATIYDINTGQQISRLVPTISNAYMKNRATFSQNDELVLSDGVLWDVNAGKEIHKFDKLNQNLSGVFHPNGNEVVSNTEIWDMRTYNLLRTVPALDQSQITFAPSNTIYTISLEQESDTGETYESSFKTLDATDYSSIATIDVRRNIYYLSVNRWDSQIALVENQGLFDSVQESAVRLYDVGRRRDLEDQEEDEDDDDEEDMDASDDDGSDDGSTDADVEGVANLLLNGANENENQNNRRDRSNRRNRARRNNRDRGNDNDLNMSSSGESSDSTFNMSNMSSMTDDFSDRSELSPVDDLMFD